LETKEQVLDAFASLGDASNWSSAIELFTETGNVTQLDAKAADHLLSVAKEGSYDIFSPASLVLYYLKCRQAAANIRTIVVGKNNGQSADDIRANLRLAYVND
jgi:vacuolar-type H+-ATPase subunit C/Vma6